MEHFIIHICFANTLSLFWLLCLHCRGGITDPADNCGMHARGGITDPAANCGMHAMGFTGENLNYGFPN